MIYRTSDYCRRVIHNHRFHYPIFTATIFVLMNYLSYLQKFTKSIITVLNLLPACKYIFVSTKQQFSFSCLPFPYDSQSLMDFLLEHHADVFWTNLATVEMPSTNFVLNKTLALLNIPSFSETTINCEWRKCWRSIIPIFCVWERSSAASTSSRIYIGAGLNSSNDRIKESATKDLKETKEYASSDLKFIIEHLFDGQN